MQEEINNSISEIKKICASKKFSVYVLTHINQNVVIHKKSGDSPKDLLIAPSWNLHKKWIINGIEKKLKNIDFN